MTAAIHIGDFNLISQLMEEFANNVYPKIKEGIDQGKEPQDFYETVVESYGDGFILSLRDFKIGAFFGMIAVGYKERAIINKKIARLIV